MRVASKSRRGFTLTELAIVLGVIGSVVGVIFVAGYEVRYQLALKTGLDQINQIAQNTRSLYAGRNATFAALNAARPLNTAPTPADFTYYMTIFTNTHSGVIPPEMIYSTFVGGTHTNNPWNLAKPSNTAQVALAQAAGSSVVQVVVEFNSLGQGPCTDLLVRNSNPAQGVNLSQIVVNGTTFLVAALPISPLTAGGVCTLNTTNVIDWYYNLATN